MTTPSEYAAAASHLLSCFSARVHIACSLSFPAVMNGTRRGIFMPPNAHPCVCGDGEAAESPFELSYLRHSCESVNNRHSYPCVTSSSPQLISAPYSLVQPPSMISTLGSKHIVTASYAITAHGYVVHSATGELGR
eukprot:IDg5424t1